MMSGIGPRNTKPEVQVRAVLRKARLPFSTHSSSLPGRPDVVLSSRRVAVLVHGCFWHRHPRCRYASTPTSNREFWQLKFSANRARDRRNVRDLAAAGWRVFVVWECEARDAARLARFVTRVRRFMTERSRPATGRLILW